MFSTNMHRSILRSKEKDVQKSPTYSVLISWGNTFFCHMDVFKGAFSWGSIITPQWLNKGFLSLSHYFSVIKGGKTFHK